MAEVDTKTWFENKVITALEAEIKDYKRELEAARAERDDARNSLAQEIHGCLKSRGIYSPGIGTPSDLIGAVGMAIDTLRAEVSRLNPCGHTGLESSVCQVCGYPDPPKMIVALRAEVGRLSELLWGSRCVYCGEVFGKDRKSQDIADEVLREHVLVCKKHPAFKLKADLAAAVEVLRELHPYWMADTTMKDRVSAFLARLEVK